MSVSDVSQNNKKKISAMKNFTSTNKWKSENAKLDEYEGDRMTNLDQVN